uniref:Disease resistance RPP13-like protein 1 n=1 Tax=Ananas comosus var. bracteatus TaxID=296719 RepID=A0A6V7QCX5_ANACO|nr:unnamed protein product [Ananas comosus var. bracteatus]
MAAGFVSSIIKWTAEKFSSLTPAQSTAGCSTFEPHARAIENFEMLQKTMQSIQDALDNTDEKDVRSFSEKLRLKELSGAARDAEDVFEEYEYEVLRAKAKARSRRQVDIGRKRKLEEVCETSTDDIPVLVPVPNDLIIRMKEIKKKFDAITKEWDTLRLRETDGPRRRNDHAWMPKPTSSLVHEPNVHGREDDKENIIQMLLEDDENSRNSVSVLPIVGMGGIGKTTLAQLVYNDPKVSHRFRQKGWVCVSENFDVLELTRKIFTSITKGSCDYTELNEIVDALREELIGKRFLLVLDDVWIDNPNLWNPLRNLLFALESGKVIVTTRNESTATIMQTMLLYRLDRLGFDDCWLIFVQQAFEGRDPNALPELVEIGKKIVVKCKGLPLAVKVLGGLLRFESDEGKWIDILDSELWELDEEEDQILPALRLSYDRMPPALKQCFMYFSLFPKDYQFYKNDIIRLLMSQGLFRSDGTKLEEDIGRGFLDDLLQRSILEYDRNCEDKESLKMHDLVHDLAQSVVGEEFIRVDDGELCNLPGEVRHLSLIWSNSISNLNLLPLKKLEALRTFIIILRDGLQPEVRVDVLSDLFRNLKTLRALDLRWTRIGALPESIGNLKLLRYLDVRYTDVKRLPGSIFSLYNLQTLGIKYDPLAESSEAIKELINLRHLLFEGNEHTNYLPSGIRHLTNLQTMMIIPIGRDPRHFRIQDLKNLSHLKKMQILNLKNIDSVEDAQEANLRSKIDLKVLQLSWERSSALYCNTSCEQSSGEPSKVPSEATRSLLPVDWFEERVLASLEPHTNLAELLIYCYGGIRFPQWVGDVSFSKLVKITLLNCQKCILLPSLGQLPSLTYLNMSYIESLQHIRREFYGCSSEAKGFPSLEILAFSSMDNWVEWGGGEYGDFPRLQEISIGECPKLQRLPQHLYSSLTRLVLSNCEQLDELPLLPSLTHLTLRGKFNEKMLSSLHLHLLRFLEITGLKTLPVEFRKLCSLQKLCISYCYGLETVVSLYEHPSLEELSVRNSPQVQFRLHSSEDVITRNCPVLQEWCRRHDIDLTYSGVILYKNSMQFLRAFTSPYVSPLIFVFVFWKQVNLARKNLPVVKQQHSRTSLKIE